MKLCTEARAVVERMREGKGEESNEDEDVYQRVVDESQWSSYSFSFALHKRSCCLRFEIRALFSCADAGHVLST